MFGRDCVSKQCLNIAYKRHLERWPSANKKYEVWKAESGAASSASPPQSAGLSSAASSTSSKKRKRTESKPYRLTQHQHEAQLVVDLKEDSAKQEFFCKITKFLHDKRKKGRYSTNKALDVFSAEMKEAGVRIQRHTLDWRMRKGYVGVAAPKPGPASMVPAVALDMAASYMDVCDINGRPQDLTTACERLKGVLASSGVNIRVSTLQKKLLKTVLQKTDLRGHKRRMQEAARWAWCTYANLDA